MNRKLITGILAVSLLVVFGVGLAFAGGGSEEEAMEQEMEEMEAKGPIVVASKLDTEAILLGTVILQILEHNGFTVEDRTNFGTTDVIRKAITSNEIDIYPEYTGNGAFFYPGEADAGVWKDPRQGYATIKRLDEQNNNLIWLQPGTANNTWAIAIRRDLADSEGLNSMQDMGDYISRGGYFKLAASEEFVSREDVLPAFEQAYGFSLEESQLLTFSSGSTTLTEQAAGQQTDGVNAAMAYGTDAQLSAFDLKVMEDSKGVQPVYNPAPLIRGEVLEQYPEIEDLLAPVFLSFDLETLQRLNGAIAVEGQNTATVVREYLTANGFLR